jgi:hypothetical protein
MRLFRLTALLGVFLLWQSQSLAGPFFFGNIAANNDIHQNITITGNNNIVNNIILQINGNVFGIVGGALDPEVPAWNPFNEFNRPGAIRPGHADATYSPPPTNLSTATFSGPGGVGQNINGLRLVAN